MMFSVCRGVGSDQNVEGGGGGLQLLLQDHAQHRCHYAMTYA